MLADSTKQQNKIAKIQFGLFLAWQIIFLIGAIMQMYINDFVKPDGNNQKAPRVPATILILWVLLSSLTSKSNLLKRCTNAFREQSLWKKFSSIVFCNFTIALMAWATTGILRDDVSEDTDTLMWFWGFFYYVTTFGATPWNIVVVILFLSHLPSICVPIILISLFAALACSIMDSWKTTDADEAPQEKRQSSRHGAFILLFIGLPVAWYTPPSSFVLSVFLSSALCLFANEIYRQVRNLKADYSKWEKIGLFLFYGFLWANIASSILYYYYNENKGKKPIWILGFMLYAHARGFDLQNVTMVYAFTLTSIAYNDGRDYETFYEMVLFSNILRVWIISAALFCSLKHRFSTHLSLYGDFEVDATDNGINEKKECTGDIKSDYEPLLDV